MLCEALWLWYFSSVAKIIDKALGLFLDDVGMC